MAISQLYVEQWVGARDWERLLRSLNDNHLRGFSESRVWYSALPVVPRPRTQRQLPEPRGQRPPLPHRTRGPAISQKLQQFGEIIQFVRVRRVSHPGYQLRKFTITNVVAIGWNKGYARLSRWLERHASLLGWYERYARLRRRRTGRLRGV